MGFKKRNRSGKLINGSTMIVPGGENINLVGQGGPFNQGINKFKFGKQTTEPQKEEPKIIPQPQPLPSPSVPPPTPTPTPTPSITATNTPTVTPTLTQTPTLSSTQNPTPTPTNTETPTPTPTNTETPTPTPSQQPQTLYFGNATLQSVTGDNIYNGTSLINYLFSFSGANNNSGYYPYGNTVVYNNLIYGVTVYGGNLSVGSVGDIYTLDPSTNQVTQVAVFSSSSGYQPYIGLILGSDNNMYGVTGNDSTTGKGWLYKFDPITSAITYLHHFTAVTTNNLVEYNNIIYGLNYDGGILNAGSIYSYDLSTSAFTVIRNFVSASDGANPSFEGMVYDGGYLYGTAQAGGSFNYGTLYRLEIATNNFVVLNTFNYTTGMTTTTTLQLYNGKLYNSFALNSTNNNGSYFSYDISTSAITTVAQLNASSSYGATGQFTFIDNNLFAYYYGGNNSDGTLCKTDIISGITTQLVSFSGTNPSAGLTYYQGKLYGATSYGGTNNAGRLYSFEYSEPMSTILSTSLNQTFVFPSCYPAQYQYIVIPQSFGTPSSFVDQFANPVAMESPYTTTVQSVVCNVYRTTNAITTGITITVS